MQEEYSTRGSHYAVDFYGVHSDILNDYEFLKAVFTFAIGKTGATIEGVQGKKFEPTGCTLLFLLSESHASIHTYPDKGYAGVDIYTCGNTVDPKLAVDLIRLMLSPKETHEVHLERGLGRENFFVINTNRTRR